MSRRRDMAIARIGSERCVEDTSDTADQLAGRGVPDRDVRTLVLCHDGLAGRAPARVEGLVIRAPQCDGGFQRLGDEHLDVHPLVRDQHAIACGVRLRLVQALDLLRGAHLARASLDADEVTRTQADALVWQVGVVALEDGVGAIGGQVEQEQRSVECRLSPPLAGAGVPGDESGAHRFVVRLCEAGCADEVAAAASKMILPCGLSSSRKARGHGARPRSRVQGPGIAGAGEPLAVAVECEGGDERLLFRLAAEPGHLGAVCESPQECAFGFRDTRQVPTARVGDEGIHLRGVPAQDSSEPPYTLAWRRRERAADLGRRPAARLRQRDPRLH